jgi:glutamine amidotransferase PdxT
LDEEIEQHYANDKIGASNIRTYDLSKTRSVFIPSGGGKTTLSKLLHNDGVWDPERSRGDPLLKRQV